MDKLLAFLDAERGRRQALASALGCSPSAISMWKQVPHDRLGDVARLTGISAAELRPDLAGLFAGPSTGVAGMICVQSAEAAE